MLSLKNGQHNLRENKKAQAPRIAPTCAGWHSNESILFISYINKQGSSESKNFPSPLYFLIKNHFYSAKTVAQSALFSSISLANCLAPSKLWFAAQPHCTSLHAGTSVASSTSWSVFSRIVNISS